MTTQQAKEFIGKRALMRVPLSKSFIQVKVLITDHRYFFGRDDVLVAPIDGIGSGWVAADSIVTEGAQVAGAQKCSPGKPKPKIKNENNRNRSES